MLLITRGFEPKTNNEVFNGFIDKFIGAGLVDEKFREIIAFARDNKNAVLTGFSSSIFELADTVIRLYENMDDSLQFNIPEKEIFREYACQQYIEKGLQVGAMPYELC
jgi:sulfite reductase (ferredoxin)